MTHQLSIFDWQPPSGERDGETFSRSLDFTRLNKQAQAVARYMQDGMWHSLAEISDATGAPEASVSARLRDFRKPKFGGVRVDRARWYYAGSKKFRCWMYRVVL